MLKDRYGNLMSTSSRAAVEKFDQACELIRLYRGDPIAALDAVIEDDPDCAMAWAARAGILVQQADKAYCEEAERSIRAGAAANGNERERAHLEAARHWLEGRIHDATTGFARIAQDHPRDLIALQGAHLGCFYLGRQSELRDWPVQSLRAFGRGDDGYHAVLGMAAFGYEECGDYARADAAGREAVEMEPRDAWAVHAVAHVNEMRGDVKRGIPWLRDSADSWAPENGFAFHNWWHLALLHLDNGAMDEVLKLYDTKVRPGRFRGAAGVDRCVRTVVAVEARRCRCGIALAIAGHELGAHRGRRLLRLQRPARDHGVSRCGAFARCRAHACGDAAGRLQRHGQRVYDTRGRACRWPRPSSRSMRATMPKRWRRSARCAASRSASAARMRSATSSRSPCCTRPFAAA